MLPCTYARIMYNNDSTQAEEGERGIGLTATVLFTRQRTHIHPGPSIHHSQEIYLLAALLLQRQLLLSRLHESLKLLA
jgi:hypothetical protein